MADVSEHTWPGDVQASRHGGQEADCAGEFSIWLTQQRTRGHSYELDVENSGQDR